MSAATEQPAATSVRAFHVDISDEALDDLRRRIAATRLPSRELVDDRSQGVPGYGFSAEPTEVGWNVGRIGQAWAELMRRLGYTRYVAQGGDVGAAVTDAMGRQAPAGCSAST